MLVRAETCIVFWMWTMHIYVPTTKAYEIFHLWGNTLRLSFSPFINVSLSLHAWSHFLDLFRDATNFFDFYFILIRLITVSWQNTQNKCEFKMMNVNFWVLFIQMTLHSSECDRTYLSNDQTIPPRICPFFILEWW